MFYLFYKESNNALILINKADPKGKADILLLDYKDGNKKSDWFKSTLSNQTYWWLMRPMDNKVQLIGKWRK